MVVKCPVKNLETKDEVEREEAAVCRLCCHIYVAMFNTVRLCQLIFSSSSKENWTCFDTKILIFFPDFCDKVFNMMLKSE